MLDQSIENFIYFYSVSEEDVVTFMCCVTKLINLFLVHVGFARKVAILRPLLKKSGLELLTT